MGMGPTYCEGIEQSHITLEDEMTITTLTATIDDAATFEYNDAIRKARELGNSRLWQTTGYTFRHVTDFGRGPDFRIQVIKRDGTLKGYYGEQS